MPVDDRLVRPLLDVEGLGGGLLHPDRALGNVGVGRKSRDRGRIEDFEKEEERGENGRRVRVTERPTNRYTPVHRRNRSRSRTEATWIQSGSQPSKPVGDVMSSYRLHMTKD